MNNNLVSLLVLGGVLVGCGKSETPAPKAPSVPTVSQVAPVATTQPTAPTQPSPGAPPAPGALPPPSTAATPDATAATSTNSGAAPPPFKYGDVEVLNDRLRDFISAYGRVPTDLTEMVNMRIMRSVPIPPEGKKFVIEADSPTSAHVSVKSR